jgi:hypothetical protein
MRCARAVDMGSFQFSPISVDKYAGKVRARLQVFDIVQKFFRAQKCGSIFDSAVAIFCPAFLTIFVDKIVSNGPDATQSL